MLTFSVEAYPYVADLVKLMHETSFPTVLTAQEIVNGKIVIGPLSCFPAMLLADLP